MRYERDTGLGTELLLDEIDVVGAHAKRLQSGFVPSGLSEITRESACLQRLCSELEVRLAVIDHRNRNTVDGDRRSAVAHLGRNIMPGFTRRCRPLPWRVLDERGPHSS